MENLLRHARNGYDSQKQQATPPTLHNRVDWQRFQGAIIMRHNGRWRLSTTGRWPFYLSGWRKGSIKKNGSSGSGSAGAATAAAAAATTAIFWNWTAVAHKFSLPTHKLTCQRVLTH